MTEPLAFELRTRQWATIDGQMDNSAAMARQDSAYPMDDDDGDTLPPPDALPVAIRQAGWDQGMDAFNSPDDAIVMVALARGQWEYVVAELRAAQTSYEQLGDNESLELIRSAVTAVERQLSV